MDEPKPPKPSNPPNHLLEVTKHVFVGVGVFLLIAIPAIALDFFNQGIEVLEFQRSATVASEASSATHQPPSADAPSTKAQEPIKVSWPVRLVLHGVEYLILAVDTAFVVGYLTSGLWKFLRSLTWK